MALYSHEWSGTVVSFVLDYYNPSEVLQLTDKVYKIYDNEKQMWLKGTLTNPRWVTQDKARIFTKISHIKNALYQRTRRGNIQREMPDSWYIMEMGLCVEAAIHAKTNKEVRVVSYTMEDERDGVPKKFDA